MPPNFHSTSGVPQVLPPRATADSAIGVSADVWASLVANIGPLLILVGEKHVKAYFKTMNRQSHYILFAAGPIGLVTTVVTLIRLYGSPILCRIIGRQFETKGETLADVTSVSYGEVSLELKDGRSLEQTTNPDPSNLANFYVRGNFHGTGPDVLFDRSRLLNVIDSMCSVSRSYTQLDGDNIDRIITTNSLERQRTMHMVTKYSATFPETQAHTATSLTMPTDDYARIKKARLFAIMQFVWDPESKSRHAKGIEDIRLLGEGLSGASAVCVSIPGVSMGLTSSHALDTWKTDMARYAIATLFLLGNMALIIMNWKIQNDIQNTVLISVGLVVSSVGSYVAAYFVDYASDEHVVRLDSSLAKASQRGAGFFSESHPIGTKLSMIPDSVVISTTGQEPVSNATVLDSLLAEYNNYERRSRFTITTKVLANTTVVFMVLGYVALYLGLRTSEWWVALSILGISALSSIARGFLAVPGGLALIDPAPPIRLHEFEDVDVSLERVQKLENSNLRRHLSAKDINIDTSALRKNTDLDEKTVGAYLSNGDLDHLSPDPAANCGVPWPWPLPTANQNVINPPQLLQACRLGETYSIIHCSGQPKCDEVFRQKIDFPYLAPSPLATGPSPLDINANLCHNFEYFEYTALMLCIKMMQRGLIPLELTADRLKISDESAYQHLRNVSVLPLYDDGVPRTKPKGKQGILERNTYSQVLFSDLLSQDGVWRQPLEILVASIAPVSSKYDPRASMRVALNLWLLRSCEIWIQGGQAVRIAEQNTRIVIGLTGKSTTSESLPMLRRGFNGWWARLYDPTETDYLSSLIAALGNELKASMPMVNQKHFASMCWTGAKIAMALFANWSADQATELLGQMLPDEGLSNQDLLLREEYQDILIDYLVTAGLAVSVPAPATQ